jgi:hypothetical protein
MAWSQIIPLAFVMIAGPQIITSFFFATTDRWARISSAYVGGAAISITAFVTAAYIVGHATHSAAKSKSSTSGHVLDWIILALVVVLILRVFLTRKSSAPPKWMAKLQDATPKLAFTLGLLLLGVFPTDILTSITAGLHIARHDEPWWHCFPFIGVTLLFLGLPAILVLALGTRAKTVLPKIQQWMNSNSWVVSEIVLVFFAAVTINSLVG